ncbi:PREDICTED: putative F-box protein At3g58960 [Camelina sativa]|uniref:F-box protein At3g58960 n=1 Tax=Camelina sativa TaxID=90675 RepID=A0ABM0VPI8_CAMSA|nr:PREDICTED: putative F-box protein At3g58960 [Camelina sativa]
MDSISISISISITLPDDIIIHIVSLLSAKEAAFVSLLSKRWQNMFTIIPNVEFDDDSIQVQGMMDFLNAVLVLPPSSRVKSLSLKCRKDRTRYDHINRCLCNVLKRGVMDLKLDLRCGHGYRLPFYVFSCKTLVELHLGTGLVVDLLTKNALLPALKTLIIDSVRFYDHCGCAFQMLLSACPVLVELVMRDVELEHWQWSRTVSSPTLQRLAINHRYFFDVIHYDLESITFDTPSLTSLSYFDFAPRSYPIVNLCSLVEASVGLSLPDDHVWIRQYAGDHDTITLDITNLIKGLRNVEILKLSTPMTLEAFYCFLEVIPVFENLHRLCVTSEHDFRWPTLPYLLKKSPVLKTLFIKGPLHYNYYSDDDDEEPVFEYLPEYDFLLSCPVKVLEITEYSGTRGELEQIKLFLENLLCLELVKVCVCETDYEEQIQLKTNLLNLPRSSKCNIQFFMPHGKSV